jgi:hypothetical protein
MFRRSSAAVATSREGHRLPTLGPANRHLRLGREQISALTKCRRRRSPASMRRWRLTNIVWILFGVHSSGS